MPDARTTSTRCPTIARKSQIPVIADIHFQPKYVFAAIDAGCAAVRVNPGNIKQFDDQVKEIAKAAGDAGVPIRIGVNAGSLDKRLLEKYGKATPEALVESALWECSLFEEHGFRDIKISVKHNDPVVMVQAYRLLAAQCDYPLHLGVTEAGPAFQGTIKSAVAFGALLSEGIGDTIRVSLSAPPVEEVKVGNQILESLDLRERGLEIVSCPSCGRAQVDVYTLAEEVTAGLEGLTVPLRVAVMGCVVNGPGEAREADLGVASGNGKGQIFVKGEVIKTVPEAQIVETLIEEALRLAEEMGVALDDEPAPGSGPIVEVAIAPVLGTATLRVLDARDRAAVDALLARDPVADCFVASRVAASALDPARLGGELWGWLEEGRLVSLCYAGANLVPVQATAAAIEAFAERALRRGRRCSSIVGPQEVVEDLWARLTPQWGPGREIRRDQPLMQCTAPPLVEPDARVRRVRPTSSTACCPPRSRCSPRRSGSPRWPTGAAALYRARLAELIERGRAFARIDDGRVVFKAEVAAVTERVCQVQGVWVDPGCAATATARPGWPRSWRSPPARSPPWCRCTSTTTTSRPWRPTDRWGSPRSAPS